MTEKSKTKRRKYPRRKARGTAKSGDTPDQRHNRAVQKKRMRAFGARLDKIEAILATVITAHRAEATSSDYAALRNLLDALVADQDENEFLENLKMKFSEQAP